MTDHPARWLIFIITLIITARTGWFLLKLRRNTRAMNEDDDMAEYMANNRYHTVEWLFYAQCCFSGWGLVIISVSTQITWRTVLSALFVSAGQLLVARAIQNKIHGDEEFKLRFKNRTMFYCTNLSCDTRASLIALNKDT